MGYVFLTVRLWYVSLDIVDFYCCRIRERRIRKVKICRRCNFKKF